MTYRRTIVIFIIIKNAVDSKKSSFS